MRKYGFFLFVVFLWQANAAFAQKSVGIVVTEKTISISPSFATLRVGGRYGDYGSGGWTEFRAKINGEYRDGIANWTINGNPAGNTSIGFLTGYEGDYVTPAQLPPNPPYVKLRAARKDNPNDYDEITIRLVDTPRSYRLLVDLSHSFLFSWHNAAYNFQLGQPLQVTASLQKSLKPELLENYDAVIITNGHTDVPFLDYEILAVKDFVNQGGGLLLVSENANGQAPVNEVNRLAKNFGIRFGEPALRPFVTAVADNTAAKPAVLAIDSAITVDSNSGQTEILATDSRGLAIALKKKFGNGNVAAIGSIDIVNNQQNRPFLLALIERLSQNMTAKTKTDMPVLFDAGCDNRLPLQQAGPAIEVCIADALLNYYPPALKLLMQKVPEVMKIETRLLGYVFPREKISIDMITAGGFSSIGGDGTAHVGVALVKEPLVDNVGIFAHEVLGPWHYPRTVVQPIGETISMWHSEEAFIQMGGEYTASGRATRNWHLGNFFFGDPTFVKFDIAKDFYSNTPVAFGKVHWIFDALRFYLGEDFFRKYWQTIQNPVNGVCDWPGSLTTDDFIFWMSVANEVNLFPFFEGIGTTVHPENYPVLPYKALSLKKQNRK